MQKFPELADVDLQVLKDYAQTAKENNYDYEVVNAKFPELFSAAPVKKKDTSESLLEDGGSEQSVFEGDAQRPLQEIVDESPIVNGDDYRTQPGPSPYGTQDISNLNFQEDESEKERVAQAKIDDPYYGTALGAMKTIDEEFVAGDGLIQDAAPSLERFCNTARFVVDRHYQNQVVRMP